MNLQNWLVCNDFLFVCRDAEYAFSLCERVHGGFEEETCIWQLQRDGKVIPFVSL